MALSDCNKCWDTPCTCGEGYKDWPLAKIQDQIGMLTAVAAEYSNRKLKAVRQDMIDFCRTSVEIQGLVEHQKAFAATFFLSHTEKPPAQLIEEQLGARHYQGWTNKLFEMVGSVPGLTGFTINLSNPDDPVIGVIRFPDTK